MQQQARTEGRSPQQGPADTKVGAIVLQGSADTKIGAIVLQGERWMVVAGIEGGGQEDSKERRNLYCRPARAEEISVHQVQEGAAAKKNARGYCAVVACTGFGLVILWGYLQAYWIPLFHPPALDLVLRSAITLGGVWILWTFFNIGRAELQFAGGERYTFDRGPDGKQISIQWKRRAQDGIWEVTSRRGLPKIDALLEAAEKVTGLKEGE